MFKFLLHKYVEGFITSESVILNLKWGYFFIKEKGRLIQDDVTSDLVCGHSGLQVYLGIVRICQADL